MRLGRTGATHTPNVLRSAGVEGYPRNDRTGMSKPGPSRALPRGSFPSGVMTRNRTTAGLQNGPELARGEFPG